MVLDVVLLVRAGKEIWYNADLFARAGVTTPKQLEKDGKWTWDALLEAATRLTRREDDGTTSYGFNYAFTDTATYIHQLYAWGGDWFDANYTKPTINDPHFIDATQFAVDMVTKQRVAGSSDFTKGKLAMQLTGSPYARTVDEVIMRTNPFRVEMTLLPKGPGGRAVAIAQNANGIAKASKAPEATWLFYKHLLSKDVQPQVAMVGGGRYVASKKITPIVVGSYEDAAVYQASAAISRATPLIVKQADMNTDWTDGWKAMTTSARSVRDEAVTLQDQLTLLLKDSGCVC